MSPVSPVFRTVLTVRIGLKAQWEWEHPFHYILTFDIKEIVWYTLSSLMVIIKHAFETGQIYNITYVKMMRP